MVPEAPSMLDAETYIDSDLEQEEVEEAILWPLECLNAISLAFGACICICVFGKRGDT